MRKLIFLSVIILNSIFSSAQDGQTVESLIQEGIALHDKGDYKEAIKRYDAALKIDKNNFNASYEKTYSLYAMGELKDCISLCRSMIKDFKDHPALDMIYMQYGSALDDIGKSKDALEVYEDGISRFPDKFLLHFNKGLTLQKTGRNDEALLAYQQSLQLKPLHSSSNYYTGMLLQKTNRIPALLSYATFLAIEPKSKRSKDAFDKLNEIIGGNVKKEGNNISIFLDPSLLDKKNKNAENNFSTVDMIFSLLAATDNNKSVDSIASTPADKLSLKLQLLINSLGESKKDNKGFYWDHYVPFFVAMKEKNQVSTLAHLIYMSTNDEANQKWVEENETKIDEFYDWLKSYGWK